MVSQAHHLVPVVLRLPASSGLTSTSAQHGQENEDLESRRLAGCAAVQQLLLVEAQHQLLLNAGNKDQLMQNRLLPFLTRVS